MEKYLHDIVWFRTRRTPHRRAIMEWETQKWYTWGDLYDRTNRMVHFLKNIAHVKEGDRVGFLTPTSMYMIDGFFSTYFTGAILDTFNYRLECHELGAMAAHEEPAVLFYDAAYQEKALEMVCEMDTPCLLVCIGENEHLPEGAYRASDIDDLKPDDSLKVREVDPDAAQILIHTGGTTGMPKAGILTYRSVFMNSVSEILCWQLTGDDVTYAAMPLYHTTGWNVLFLPLLLMGGKAIITREFSPDVFYDIVEQEHPSYFMGADAIYRALIAHPRFKDADFSGFKGLVGGASPISVSTMEPFWDMNIPFIAGYGMTESGPNNVSPSFDDPIEERRAKPFTVGKPALFTEIRVISDDGNIASVNEPGEIYMRGALTFKGYWKCPDQTDEMLNGGWVHTGDVGFIDEDGDLTICGRTKHMYISGGENIFPIEIERFLEKDPSISQACVIGVPDERWGEVGKAMLVPTPGMTIDLDRIHEYLNGLSTIKHPKYYEIVDSLPINHAGKLNRKAIRKRYGGA